MTIAWRAAEWPRSSAAVRRRDRPAGPTLSGRTERMLVREQMPGGEVAASNHALYVCTGEGLELSWRRIRWADVRSVGGSRLPHQKSAMVLELRTPAAGSLTITVDVRARSRIPALAADLVTSTLVASRRVVMSNRRTVTFLARRDPDTAKVGWTTEFERAEDQHDPALQPEIAETLREIRALMGC